MRCFLISLAISCVFPWAGCRFDGKPSTGPTPEAALEAERGSGAAEAQAEQAPAEGEFSPVRDEVARPDVGGPPRTDAVAAEPPTAPELSPEPPGRPPQELPSAADAGSDTRRQPLRADAARGSGAVPFGTGIVPLPVELGVGVFRRRLDTAARLGAAMILLPPSVRLNEEGQFVFEETSAGFGPADIDAPVVLWPEANSIGESDWRIAVDTSAGTMLLLDSRTADDASEVARRLDRLLRTRENEQGDLVLVTDRPLWTAAPALWAELASLPGMSEQAVVLAFSRIGEMREEQRGGIRCVVVPHQVVRDEAGTVWVSQGRGDPDVSRLHADAVSDIRRVNPRIQEERDSLVKSLTVTPVCGLRTETTVRFRNTLDAPLDVRADWTFGNEEVPVKPEILGFQLDPDEEFSQVFRFQNDDNDTPLKFLRPRFVLSMNAPDGAGGESPLVVQAAPVCCMRGVVELVDEDVVLDGDPSEWAGRGYSLNHESQVVEGLDAWGGPGDLSANLFVSRTSDSVLLGAHIYDDQHGKSDQDSRAALSIAVDLLPFQTLGSGIGAFSVLPNPTDQASHSPTGLPPVLSEPTEPDNNNDERASGRPGRIELHFTKQTGIRIAPELEGVQARWSETAETLSVEARIPVELFADSALGSPLRLDAALSESSDDDRHVCLVFSGRDPELKNPDLFGIFRVTAPEEDSE